MDGVNLAMLDDIQAVDLTAEFDGETLETETDTEDGSEKSVRDVPDVFDDADVLGNIWGAWSRPYDDGVEVWEEGKEG